MSATDAPGGRPKVSVVLPTFNRKQLLGASLRALRRQTFQDFELIVVDDGSSDGTEAAARGLAEPRLRYLRMEHRGLPFPLNSGIELARGEYVLFASDDDVFEPRALSELTAALDKHRSAAFACCDILLVDAAGRELRRFSPGWGQELVPGLTFLERRLLPGSGSICALNLVRRDALGDRLLDPSLGPSADVELWLRLSAAGDVAVVGSPLVRVRQRTSDSAFYYVNHILVAAALRAKRRYLHLVRDRRQRRAIERSWRHAADRAAFASLVRSLEAGRREELESMRALAEEEGSWRGRLALRLLLALPPCLPWPLVASLRRADQQRSEWASHAG